jgi:thiamine-phosphate pyrophosphorylase
MDGDRRARLERAQLYFIGGSTCVGETLRAALAGGVDVFQLREKELGDSALLRAADAARELCEEAGALFIVNDRPDVARSAYADGVHVGQDDASVAAARRMVGPDCLVGLSTHSPEQIAAADGADYLGVGPVHATPTKLGRPAVGVDLVAHAAQHARVPWFAIGGLNAANVGAVLEAGARRISVVRAIAEADDPERAARTLKAMVSDGTAGT